MLLQLVGTSPHTNVTLTSFAGSFDCFPNSADVGALHDCHEVRIPNRSGPCVSCVECFLSVDLCHQATSRPQHTCIGEGLTHWCCKSGLDIVLLVLIRCSFRGCFWNRNVAVCGRNSFFLRFRFLSLTENWHVRIPLLQFILHLFRSGKIVSLFMALLQWMHALCLTSGGVDMHRKFDNTTVQR